jgi:hypothetical protein
MTGAHIEDADDDLSLWIMLGTGRTRAMRVCYSRMEGRRCSPPHKKAAPVPREHRTEGDEVTLTQTYEAINANPRTL